VGEDKNTSQWLEVIGSVLKSVTKRRLVETENPSICAPMKWKL
jgi:hypothetical protein